MALSTISIAANPLIYPAAILAGLAAGVAANVLADRIEGDEELPIPEGSSASERNALADQNESEAVQLWSARHCRKCGSPLPASRLVPLLNVRASARSCTRCGKPASLRGPLITLALAVIYPLLLAHLLTLPEPTRIAPMAIFAIDALGGAVLAFVFAVDLEHHLIFDIAVYPAVAALLAVALLFDHKALASMLFGVVICGGLFALLYALGFLLYRTEALGLGDVKLAVLIGMLVGWPGILTALLLTALIGAGISVLVLGLGSATSRSYIAYGTAMAAGAVAALLFAAPLW